MDIIPFLWLGWLLVWAVSAFNTKKTVYYESGVPWLAIFAIAFVFAAALSILPNAKGSLILLMLPAALSSYLLQAAATIITAAGLLFSVWARFYLGRNWSSMPSLKENHELIKSGPYGIVRHPIYSGLLLAWLGTAISYGVPGWFILIMPVWAIFIWIKIRQEEKLMLRQFPKEYPKYMARVKALIPCVL